MRVEGRAYKDNYLIHVLLSERDEPGLRFVKQLENCLIDICHQLYISPPLWMEKNTHEFAAWHQTVFHADQFMEEVPFARLQIKWLDDER